ncbi:MAG: TrbI/VirB10 family protein [Acidobacteriaceae bacterium]|nr:TrbI/VirB10 family protein [Acidobacteriaceae bacterium]
MSEQSVPQPSLQSRVFDPKGVFRKNTKPLLYLGAAALVILAAIFSSYGKKTTASAASKNAPPQPLVQDNTENNVQDLKDQVDAAKQKQAQDAAAQAALDPTLANATAAQRTVAAGYGSNGQGACAPGQPCPYSSGGGGQPSAVQQERQMLAAKESDKAFDGRFSSNLAFVQPAAQESVQSQVPVPPSGNPQTGGPASPAAHTVSAETSTSKRAPEVNIDSATGQPYVIYEGTTVDTVLMNRLDGDAVGPVKVLVSNPVYSHDHQHVLIPEGTIALGEAKKVGSSGFGQQRRMAVVFHRLIMPDGYSVDLDQFHGLDQIGEEGLKDKVNNHYLQIFGASIALGVIAGASEITEGGAVLTASGPAVFASGASGSVSQSATTILDRFMQIPPTITIREGHRVKLYITQDMLLPAVENHTIPQSF